MTAPDITIPPEAEDAHAKVLHAFDIETCMIEQPGTQVDDYNTWDELSEAVREQYRKLSRAACLAMLKAWPGAEYVFMQPHRRAVSYSNPAIILPLTQEDSNAEA